MQNFTLTYSKGSKPKDINVKAAKSFIKRDKPPTLRPRKTQQYRSLYPTLYEKTTRRSKTQIGPFGRTK